MSCPDVLASLDSLLEGELEVTDSERVKAHIHVCAACRSALLRHERLADLLRQADRRSAPADLRRRVIETLLEEDRRNREG